MDGSMKDYNGRPRRHDEIERPSSIARTYHNDEQHRTSYTIDDPKLDKSSSHTHSLFRLYLCDRDSMLKAVLYER